LNTAKVTGCAEDNVGILTVDNVSGESREIWKKGCGVFAWQDGGKL
jgi:hypothetical protein